MRSAAVDHTNAGTAHQDHRGDRNGIEVTTMDRFRLMAAQLAGAPVPALPDLPGRLVVAVVDGADPVADAWYAIHHAHVPAAGDQHGITGPLKRIACASGPISCTGLVARLVQRAPVPDASPSKLWPLLVAQLTAEGLGPVEAYPDEVRFRGGVIKRATFRTLVAVARRASCISSTVTAQA